MCKLGCVINMDNEFNDDEEAGKGDSPAHGECTDNVESETENMMKQLKSFKRSGWWNDSDDDCISSDDDESCESSSTEEIAIVTVKESDMKKRNEEDES